MARLTKDEVGLIFGAIAIVVLLVSIFAAVFCPNYCNHQVYDVVEVKVFQDNVQIETRGFRVKLFSWYPNIVGIKEEEK